MILLVDNYDSFVFNLGRYFTRLGQTTRVVRNDRIGAEEALALRPAAIVLSPGPCTPAEAGCSLELVRRAVGRVPVLGVCLGHQTIGAALGGRVVRAPEPVHGRADAIHHRGDSLFAGLPSPLRVCRYHSLVVEADTLPAALRPTAWTADGLLMAFEHRSQPVFGVQFHPESVLTEGGYAMLATFLRRAGIAGLPDPLPTGDAELLPPPVIQPTMPQVPVPY